MSERLKLPLPFKERFKNGLWNIVMGESNFEFFQIANERLTPQHMNRQDLYFNTTAEGIENIISQSYFIYSYHPVDDPNIRGSCQEFKTRIKVDRDKLKEMSLIEIEEK